MSLKTHRRVKTYPSGKKTRLTISSSGRVLAEVPIARRANRTRIGRRLGKRRRRIGR